MASAKDCQTFMQYLQRPREKGGWWLSWIKEPNNTVLRNESLSKYLLGYHTNSREIQNPCQNSSCLEVLHFFLPVFHYNLMSAIAYYPSGRQIIKLFGVIK